MADRAFTLFLHDGSDAPAAFEVEFFADIDAAKVRALALLAERRRYHAVEISDGLTSVHVMRPSA